MAPTPAARAVFWSILFPGLGQWVSGRRADGIALACASAGIWVGLVVATVGPAHMRSWLSQLLLGATYLLVWIPSVADAARGSGRADTVALTNRPWYVVFMVLMVGAMAVPLVWQCSRLSRAAKILWSTIGILNTLAFVVFLAVLGPLLQQWLDALAQSTAPWP